MKTYHFTFAPFAIATGYNNTGRQNDHNIRPSHGFDGVFIAVEEGPELGLQLKGALICVNPRMLVILVYCQ